MIGVCLETTARARRILCVIPALLDERSVSTEWDRRRFSWMPPPLRGFAHPCLEKTVSNPGFAPWNRKHETLTYFAGNSSGEQEAVVVSLLVVAYVSPFFFKKFVMIRNRKPQRRECFSRVEECLPFGTSPRFPRETKALFSSLAPLSPA